MLVFQSPWLLSSLLLVPAVLVWRWRRLHADLLVVPYASFWRSEASTSLPWRELLPFAALALLGIAAARPLLVLSETEHYARGYDFMLAIDLSTSMYAEDYVVEGTAVNRLDALRPVLRAFVSERPGDRAGLVVFAGNAFTLAPLSMDKPWLDAQLDTLYPGMIEDGTALGDGLGIALANLEDSRGSEASDGAFVILLTDGSNNTGTLKPLDAANLARVRGIPVYAIGAGTTGMVPFPVFDANGERTGTRQRPSSFDEQTLIDIAARTGGEYFAADDSESLAAAFSRIDTSRKATLGSRTQWRRIELFAVPAVAALALLLAYRPQSAVQSPARSRPGR